MLTSILLATTIMVSQPKFAQSGTEYAFLGIFGGEERPASPRVEDEEGDATTAAAQFAALPDGKVRVAFVFDGTPIYRREIGEKAVVLHFTSPISYNQRSVTSDVINVVKSVRRTSAPGANLKLKVEFSENYTPTFHDLGDKLRIELTPKAGVKPVVEKDDKLAKAKKDKEVAEKKAAEDKKKVDDKKSAEKKLADKRAAEAKKKEQAILDEERKERRRKEELLKAEKAEEKKKAEAAKAEVAAKPESKPEPVKAEPKPEPEKVEAKNDDVSDIFMLPDAVPEKAAAKQIIKAGAEFKIADGIEQLRFDFTEKVPAAVFERFGNVFVVFDTLADVKPPAAKGSQTYNSIDRIKSDALVYKIALKNKAKFSVYAVDNSWFIDTSLGQNNSVQKPLRAQINGNNWVITAKTKKSYIKLRDDWTEDDLLVLPVFDANSANVNQQFNSDFVNTPTLQGLVLKPLSDSPYKTQFEGDEIRIKITSEADKTLKQARPVTSELAPVYPFANWPQLSGNKYRDENAKAALAGKIEHANFLFSQGLYTDAVVRLKGFDSPNANFLRGAANFMGGRYNEAALALDGVNLEPGQDFNELLLWKIAANHMLGRYNPQGVVMPDTSRFALSSNIKNYPPKIAIKVLTAAAEQFIDSAQNAQAVNIIAMLRSMKLTPAQANYVDYLEGRIFAAESKKARAYEIWNKIAAADTDRESRAKATYEIIKNDIETKKIKDDAAAARMNKLLAAWKGDVFEYNLLVHLGDLYTKLGQNLSALRVYKQAITKFNNFPENIRVTEAMKALFASALKNDTNEKEQIFQNLSAYYEFKELAPVGDEGDDIITGMVDKLARYDLFSEAAGLLENHIQSVTDNTKKAEISTKAAIFHFMNRQPQKAIELLKASDSLGVPAYLKEERVLVTTRSLIDMGDLEAALIAAGGLEQGQQNRIKSEIYWKQSKWDKMIEAYKQVDEMSPDDVIKLAIANSITGNKTALKLMRGQYGEMMAKGGHSREFDYVTNTENINYRDLSGSLKINATEELIKEFKVKIKKDGVDAIVGKTDAAKPAAAKTKQ